MADREKETIERSIGQARDGVGERIDELDRKLRTSLDFKTFFPKTLRRLVGIGLPLALVAMKVKKARDHNGDEHAVV